jgi:anti-sigma factor RsiW
MSSSRTPVVEADLHALADSFLSAGRRAEVVAFLEDKPGEARRVADWCMQNEAIRRVLGRAVSDPFPQGDTVAEPPALQCIAPTRAGPHDPDPEAPLVQRPLSRPKANAIGAIGAAVALGMAVGFVGAQALAPAELLRLPVRSAPADPVASLAARAIEAHKVFAGDPPRPMEISAGNPDFLSAWLARQLGEPVALPDLSRLGFTPVGGRLLATNAGPTAMLLFAGVAGERLALMLAHRELETATSPRYFEANGTGALVWDEDADTFVLSGPAGEPRLVAIMQEMARTPAGR